MHASLTSPDTEALTCGIAETCTSTAPAGLGSSGLKQALHPAYWLEQ